MKAVYRKKFGGSDVLTISEVETPTAQPGTVLIRVRAFGLNHAELYMRRGQWGDAAAISGIEGVGNVVKDATGRLREGQTVVAVMGGMGRTINGSYAEYMVVPAQNVIAVETPLSWDRLAALPEVFATAWTILHKNLSLQKGQRLVVRAGTSALGQAAIALAAYAGSEVIGTTRRPQRAAMLHALGAKSVVASEGDLSNTLNAHGGNVDAILDLVGNSTILDSMRATKVGGYVCLAGFLGGLAPLEQFNPLNQMPSGVHLSFFGSFEFGNANYPLSIIPMQQLVDAVTAGQIKFQASRVFGFEEIALAHELMERDEAQGKLVIVL